MLLGDAPQKSKVISTAQKHDRGISNTPAAVYAPGNGQLILLFLHLPLKPEVTVYLRAERGKGTMTTGAEGNERGVKQKKKGGEMTRQTKYCKGKNKG